MNLSSKILSQWERRVVVFKYIYSLLIDDSLSVDMQENKVKEELFEKDKYVYDVVLEFIKNKSKYELMIKPYLKTNWTIDRIDYIDKSIIFASLSEYSIHKIDKKIIIDQAIITAKKYGITNSYKFINFILDKVIK